MKKIINVISLVIFTALLSLSLVSCGSGIPTNITDAKAKLKAAGYDVDDNAYLGVSGTYVAIHAWGDNGFALTVAYFDKASSKEDARMYYIGLQSKYKDEEGTEVKMEELDNLILVYYGTNKAIKDFEK